MYTIKTSVQSYIGDEHSIYNNVYNLYSQSLYIRKPNYPCKLQ